MFRSIPYLAASGALILAISAFGFAQKAPAKAIEPSRTASSSFTSSPAYAEVLLKKTDMTSELEALLVDYTEDFLKVKQIRFSLEALKRESDRLARVKAADSGRLTLALGRLIVRKVELETDLWGLLRTYKDEHPDVKRAKRKVEIYESAIKEILGPSDASN